MDNKEQTGAEGAMDAQAPQATGAPEVGTQIPVNTSETSSTPVEAVGSVVTPAAPEAQPTAEAEAVPVTSTEQPVSTDDSAPNPVPEATTTESQPMVAQTPAPHKSKGPVIAVVLAIVVALALAAIATLAYLKTNENSDAETTANTTTQAEEAAPQQAPATEADVTEAEAEIDKAVDSVNDTTDFAESNLSDQTLGL